MRALQSLALLALPLLCLLSGTAAQADSLYMVEAIVFRQPEAAIPASQLPPDTWAEEARPVDSSISRVTTLIEEAAKLTPENGYEVLLHQAWEQTIGSTDSRVAFHTGQGHFGQYPVQGTITLREKRPVEMDSTVWVNRFDEYGHLSESERLKQTIRLAPGELTYVDGGSIGLLILLRPL